jgi:cyclin A
MNTMNPTSDAFRDVSNTRGMVAAKATSNPFNSFGPTADAAEIHAPEHHYAQPAEVVAADVIDNSPQRDLRNRLLPCHVPEYHAEIMEHLLEREQTLARNGTYLTNQPDVTERMRSILIDWLIDVHLKFKLHPETYYLAVDIVDRYLMERRGSRQNLQLIGVTAMLIAAKHEEIWPPEVSECIYISANTYTRDEILSTERDIAAALSFRMCVPTTYPFAQRLLTVSDAPEDVRKLTLMYLDAAALDYSMLQSRCSRVAHAAVLLAYATAAHKEASLGNGEHVRGFSATDAAGGARLEKVWGTVLQHYSKVALADTPAMEELLVVTRQLANFTANLMSASSKYFAVKRKYTAEKYGSLVSRFEVPVDF